MLKEHGERDNEHGTPGIVSVMEALNDDTDSCSERFCHSVTSSSSDETLPTCHSHASIKSSSLRNWYEPELSPFSMIIRIINVPIECASRKIITETLRGDYQFLSEAKINVANIYEVHRNERESYTNSIVNISYRSDFRKKVHEVQFGGSHM